MRQQLGVDNIEIFFSYIMLMNDFNITPDFGVFGRSILKINSLPKIHY